MMNTSKPILFFGTEDFSLVALRALLEAHYPIVAVVTKPDSKSGRGQHLTPPAVKKLALAYHIPVWQPTKVQEVNPDISALGDVSGVLVSFGKIIPSSTLKLFTPGIINVHPSLLPAYRGPSPIESAIINGEHETGVSIMQLTAAMDAGPIYTQVHYTLTQTETQPTLSQTLAQLGTSTLLEVLPAILDGSLQPQPQQDERATYSHLLTKQDAWLDPARMNAQQAEQRIRAYLDFPKTKFTIRGHAIIITKAHITSTQASLLDVACQDGTFLSIDELIAPSGRRMSAAAFLNGYAAV